MNLISHVAVDYVVQLIKVFHIDVRSKGEALKEREGELILKLLQPLDTVVLMDEHEQEFRSIEFAKWIERKHIAGSTIIF